MMKNDTITLQPLAPRFAICKVPDYSGVTLSAPFCFTGATDEELSLVCPEEYAPGNVLVRDDGWRAFRIIGQLDFSLTGILAGIAKVLADERIGIFAVSTFNTDYVLTKEENFDRALSALEAAGYLVRR